MKEQPVDAGTGWGASGVVAAALVVLALFLQVDAQRFADPDLFVTLYSGREIVAHGGPPGIDDASFTVRGEPWRDYEYLARVVFFGLEYALGAPGLVLLRLTLFAFLVGAFLRIARRRCGSPFPFVLAAALWAGSGLRFFLFRPTLFTFTAIGLLLLVIDEVRRGRRRLLWAVPPAMVLWSNLHAGFALGIVLLALLAAESAWVEWGWGRASDEIVPARTTLAVLTASVVTSMVHPMGPRVWGAVLGTMTGSFTPFLSEWQPMTRFGFSHYAGVYLLMGVVVAVLVVARRQVLPFDALASLGLLVASLARVRFIPLFSLVAVAALLRYLPVVAGSASLPAWGTGPGARRLGRVALSLVSAGWAAAALVVAAPEDLEVRKLEWLTPVGGVRFFREQGISGNVLTEYDWGGYVRWEIPDARIFVDGRSDTVYPHAVVGEWARFVNALPGWEAVAERYRPDVILLRPDHPVIPLLEHDPRWVGIYADSTSAAFLRDAPEHHAVLERLRSGEKAAPILTDEDFRVR